MVSRAGRSESATLNSSSSTSTSGASITSCLIEIARPFWISSFSLDAQPSPASAMRMRPSSLARETQTDELCAKGLRHRVHPCSKTGGSDGNEDENVANWQHRFSSCGPSAGKAPAPESGASWSEQEGLSKIQQIVWHAVCCINSPRHRVMKWDNGVNGTTARKRHESC
jgi:hypothetical protein